MRIVGGTWRGRALKAPEGRGTRPTTDRTRESMASMVLSAFDLDLSCVRVLDAFAGSGAIGFELLSRGAQSCTFVERDRRAAGIVRDNTRQLGASASQVQLQVGDVCLLAERGQIAGGPFALVVLDPPYALDSAQVSQLVEQLRTQGQLVDGAFVMYEHAADAPNLSLADASVVKHKARGGTAVTLFRVAAHG